MLRAQVSRARKEFGDIGQDLIKSSGDVPQWREVAIVLHLKAARSWLWQNAQLGGCEGQRRSGLPSVLVLSLGEVEDSPKTHFPKKWAGTGD